ncbi:hypothetical protein [Nocardia niigatensis]
MRRTLRSEDGRSPATWHRRSAGCGPPQWNPGSSASGVGQRGRRTGSELLFVYGEYDPTRAEPFQPGPATRDSSVYIAPTTHHLARPANLTAPDRAAALATLTRWASGQPAVR